MYKTKFREIENLNSKFIFYMKLKFPKTLHVLKITLKSRTNVGELERLILKAEHHNFNVVFSS